MSNRDSNFVGGQGREFAMLPKAVQAVSVFPFLSEQNQNGATGFTVTINAGARVGGTSVTPSIEEYDKSSNGWIATPIIAGSAITAPGVARFTMGPHVATVAPSAAGAALNGCAPGRWRLRITQEGGITSQDIGATVRIFS
jgi:hypothetical protein